MELELSKGQPLCTWSSLVNDLHNLGVGKGDNILVHCSLRKIGWINGGGETLAYSLFAILGREGTLVVPTHTPSNSDPFCFRRPNLPLSWSQTIKDTMPTFNPQTSRSERMGILAETVRTWPGAARSMHPQASYSAVGPNALFITSDHRLDCVLGEYSPVARLENLDGKVLLLGVGFDVCTCFHLAEYRIGSPKGDNSFAAVVDGVRQWLTVSDVTLDHSHFLEMGQDFLKSGNVKRGYVGAAVCYLFSLKAAVKFAEQWLLSHRD